MPLTPRAPIDVLVLDDRPFDPREPFRQRLVSCLHRFMERAPSPEIRSRREDLTWDLGGEANLSLVSVVLATALEEIGASYKVWDMDNLLLNAGERVAADLRAGPRIIAASATHFSTDGQFADFVRFVRSHNPTAPLIVGGQLLDNAPRIEERIPHVDYFVHGDGEAVFPLLVRTVLEDGGRPPVRLPGVRYRHNGTFAGDRAWQPLDVNATPLPRWDLVLTRDFNDRLVRRSPFTPMVFIEETRGCPYRCAFCAYPRSTPSRLKSVERILTELRQCVASGFRHFNFYSALLTSPPDHCRELLSRIIEDNLGITFSCQARVDDLYRHPDLVDLLTRAGCVHMSLGIESGDQELLRQMKKPLQVARVPAIVARAHEAGISVCGNFFVGFPGERGSSIQATYDLLRTCDFATMYLSAFVVEPAAEVFRNREAYGLEVSEDFQRWRHRTMDCEEAQAETEKLFLKLANDDGLRTVLWAVQWQFARYFPGLLMEAHRPEVWAALRLMQKGVADELAFQRDGGAEAEHDLRQKRLWDRVTECRALVGQG